MPLLAQVFLYNEITFCHPGASVVDRQAALEDFTIPGPSHADVEWCVSSILLAALAPIVRGGMGGDMLVEGGPQRQWQAAIPPAAQADRCRRAITR
jgi:hypothetical protein